jgi:UPF0716 protein FxsA
MRLFMVYALIELAALVAVISWLGLGWTLLLLLAGSIIGMWLVKRAGARAGLAVAEAVRRGQAAHDELTDGALVGLAGLLILVPGMVSDVLGLLLLVPASRSLVRRWLVRWAERRSPSLRTARIRTGGTVIDGEVVPGQAAAAPSAGQPSPGQPSSSRRAVEG